MNFSVKQTNFRSFMMRDHVFLAPFTFIMQAPKVNNAQSSQTAHTIIGQEFSVSELIEKLDSKLPSCINQCYVYQASLTNINFDTSNWYLFCI